MYMSAPLARPADAVTGAVAGIAYAAPLLRLIATLRHAGRIDGSSAWSECTPALQPQNERVTAFSGRGDVSALLARALCTLLSASAA